VLPLSVPAAYAAGVLYRWGRDAHVSDDAISLGLVALLAVVLLGSMAWTGYATSFGEPKADENPLVQFAQPAGDVEPTLEEMRTLADRNDGTDVILYGEQFHSPSGGDALERRPTCSDWFNALPLPWYFAAGDVDADCAPDGAALEEALEDDPPVVVAWHEQRAAVDNRIDDRYDVRVFEMRSFDNEFVFYVDEDRLE
jgi:predicted membrane-bound mannosyltransferase